METGPLPVFRTIDKPRAQGVTLYVTQHRQEVTILLNRKRLESPLPDMTAGAITPMVATYMRSQQPLHPSAQITILVWPESEMKMIRHDAVRKHAHGQSLRRLSNELDERLVIGFCMKYFLSRIATIDHMIAETADGRPRCSRHRHAHSNLI